MSTSASEPENSTTPEIQFSEGWEMPDLRSPEFPKGKRPKCAGVANHQNGLFFPEQHRYQKTAEGHRMTPQIMAEDAKAVCNGSRDGLVCPVLSECLEWAMDNWQRHGIWGGLFEPDRVKLRKRREQEASELAASLEAKKRERLEKSKRAWETRRRRAAARKRGYWIPPEDERADEEVRAG